MPGVVGGRRRGSRPITGTGGVDAGVDVFERRFVGEPGDGRFDRVLVDQLAVAEHPDRRAHLGDFGQQVCVHEHRHLQIGVQPQDGLAQLPDTHRVEPGGRFVKEQHAGPVQDRLGDPDALTHPAGERSDPQVAELRAVEVVEGVACCCAGLVDAGQSGEELEVLDCCEVRIHPYLRRQVTDAACHLGTFADHVEPAHSGVTASRGDQCGEDVHRSGLASTVVAEEPEDLSVLDRKVDTA